LDEPREVPLKQILLAVVAVCLLAFSGDRARAEYTVIEVNFIMADKDGDLLISKPKYLLVAIDGFNDLDQNGNNGSTRTNSAISPRMPSSWTATPTRAAHCP
jgi:hypothetical protein